ncbi:MAG: type I secretion system permease/ATPase [Micavibrio aeruginosavorus]|uniref:Type I secretion system permease/ATPase n=1 Tax=Micavibrio aeruginosavorus TaxID=349221 RepID=A0A7T5R1Z0_9BACT|nr:MAG: type I secretion system permease/ATPase [Micavibrio aeruginosavorus]
MNKPADAKDKKDPLLECLVFLTAHHGHARSAEALKAGLSYDEKGMTPETFCEAAQRLGFRTKVKESASLRAVSGDVLPAVMAMKGARAIVLVSKGKDGKARVYDPATAEAREVKIADLDKAYAGYHILIHPTSVFTDPAQAHPEDYDRSWFWSLVHDCKGIYGRVVVASILINLFGLVSPLFIMNVYDRVIPNAAIETGWVLAIGALTAFAFDFIMRTLRGYFIDVAGRRIDVVASRRIYDQVLNMKLSGKPASGGAFANMLREFDSVRDFITSATLTALVDLPFTLLFLLAIYLLAGPVALMLFFLIMAVAGIGMLLQVSLRALVARSTHAAEAKHGLLVETIGALEAIKSIGADGRLRARYGTHVGEAAEFATHSRFISGLGVNIATFLQQSSAIIIVLMGMYMVRDGDMSMGALIAAVMLGGRAIAPIGQVANLLTRYHQSRSSLNGLNSLMAKAIERPAHKQFLHRPHLEGKIAFDRVCFSYPGTDRNVLDNLSFTLGAGEKTGIIGRVGSGKSTIARLMMGLYEPQSGALLADDTDYRQIDPADLRRNIAYIAQDVVLFRGTIRENIAIARPQASEAEILEAAQASGVHEFISRHPMGYDAPVGERGEGLSGGQRQAIALARAMLLKPQIFVCDEPTNAMDSFAEEAFVRHIKGQIADKTFVLITHRQNLLTLVDRLILIDQGKILMDDSRDRVLQALAQGRLSSPQAQQGAA